METIQLEAFQTPLHGAKILYALPQRYGQQQQHPPWSEWIHRLREPFRKAIRVSTKLLPLAASVVPAYDATFHPKDGQDWTLILTYITYAPKPLLVTIEDLSIPDGLWQKLPAHTTLLHITSHPVIRLQPYDAIFFAPMDDDHVTYRETAHRILQAAYRATYTLAQHKEILQELRMAKAGLAWTRVDEKAQGALYWYDPVAASHDGFPPHHLSELFQCLAEQFKPRGD
jgi:hypothetical protein